MKQNSNDQLLEAYYRIIGDAHLDNILSDLEANQSAIATVSVSEKLNGWFESFLGEIVNYNKRKKRHAFYRSAGTKAAIFFVALLTIIGSFSFTTDAFKHRVYNMIYEMQEEFTRIQFWSDDIEPQRSANDTLFEDTESYGGNFYPD